MYTSILSAAALVAVANAHPQGTTTASAPTPSVSITPNTIYLTEYLVSTQCEFTSTSEILQAGQCADLGGQSFSVSNFQPSPNGPASTCFFNVYKGAGCTEESSNVLATSAVNTCNEMYESEESVMLVCIVDTPPPA